jgi:glycosyltransferase involved in cell wall biosynthesis
MKVLHVESGRHLYGGARQVLYLLQGLAARGVENVLACPPGAEIAEPARAHAVVETVPMGGDLDAAMTWRLHGLIRRHRPHLVHLHSRRGADVWGALAARLAGLPCVLSRRVDNPEPRWLVAVKYRLYGHVIAISEGIRRVLLAEGLAPESVSCVRSALDPAPYLAPCDRAGLRRELELPEDAPLLAMVAQLIPRKGHRYLLEALPRLLPRHPGTRVLFFGRGPLEADLRQEVAQRGLGAQVRFMGFRTDLARWLGGLDVLVHPADMEGLGISLLQAAAAGMPIVASRAGGMPEVVRDGENGLLIPPGDVPALAVALLRLLDDGDLRRRLGEAGRALVLREFSPEAMCEGNLAVYRRLLAASGG